MLLLLLVFVCWLQLVPVYSVADSEDWKIRGYTK
jgi:hypothetical protein